MNFNLAKQAFIFGHETSGCAEDGAKVRIFVEELLEFRFDHTTTETEPLWCARVLCV